jgi:hypothetical protein
MLLECNTPQWILNDIWNEGYEDGRRNEYWNVYKSHCDESSSYTEGFHAGQRARARLGLGTM